MRVIVAMFGALMPGVAGDLTCAVQGMAYSQDNMSKTPNGAFLATPDMCQSSCGLTLYCQYFTWYNDARFGFHAFKEHSINKNMDMTRLFTCTIENLNYLYNLDDLD